jgi:hypothetical protein
MYLYTMNNQTLTEKPITALPNFEGNLKYQGISLDELETTQYKFLLVRKGMQRGKVFRVKYGSGHTDISYWGISAYNGVEFFSVGRNWRQPTQTVEELMKHYKVIREMGKEAFLNYFKKQEVEA